jgi:hypothetical protein
MLKVCSKKLASLEDFASLMQGFSFGLSDLPTLGLNIT